MIRHPAFEVHPWSLTESSLDLSVLAQTESLFALSNGHIGWRGNLDEGEPHGLPGSYLNGVHELRPLPYAEAGFGYPEAGQSILNIMNGKLMRLLVDDEPFDIRYGELCSHRRELDFRTGRLDRAVEWESPAGQVVRVSSQRLVSFPQRAIAAIRYQVEAVDTPVRIVLQSELVANEQLPIAADDPRSAAALGKALILEDGSTLGSAGYLICRTERSDIRVGAAMFHEVDGPADTEVESATFADVSPDHGVRDRRSRRAADGHQIRVVRLVRYAIAAGHPGPVACRADARPQDRLAGSL